MPVGGVVAATIKSALKTIPPILLGVRFYFLQSHRLRNTTRAAAVYIGVQSFKISSYLQKANQLEKRLFFVSPVDYGCGQ